MTAPAARVEAYMADYMAAQKALPRNLVAAMSYSLLGPGKRMRPILVVRGCEAVGGTIDQCLPAAAAIEMIHCFSLIHDDLPAMDDDDLRRGRPTLHKHTNEAMAILAGDAMMGLAFELIVTHLSPASLAAAICTELATGTNAMIAGQVYDTLPDFDETVAPVERLRTIHRNKTGALIRASVRMGALCGGADGKQLEAVTRYGDAVGLMFQIVDDVLDVTQTTEQLGKTAGKDVEQDKLTYPAVLGLDESRRQVEALRVEAHAALEPLGEAAGHLRDLCDFLAVRTK
ncbi:MAG: hypothetical protein GC162_15375 [Planctomycetes bacterium]|nr:hypothetical protein [Planctomycetota bacterium]